MNFPKNLLALSWDDELPSQPFPRQLPSRIGRALQQQHQDRLDVRELPNNSAWEKNPLIRILRDAGPPFLLVLLPWILYGLAVYVGKGFVKQIQ